MIFCYSLPIYVTWQIPYRPTGICDTKTVKQIKKCLVKMYNVHSYV